MTVLDDDTFRDLRDILAAHTGIVVPADKRAWFRSRLSRRLAAIGTTAAEYRGALADPAELSRFISAMTTNTTAFWRTPAHFTHLASWLPTDRDVTLWSAAASTGEEPWSIALCAHAAGARFRILATDIDRDALAVARRGSYSDAAVAPVPKDIRVPLTRSGSGWTVPPSLRDRVSFAALNLLATTWPMRGRFDAIFCRNVFIYFDRTTRQRIVTALTRRLTPGGYLYLGDAETLAGIDTTLRSVGPAIYQLPLLAVAC